MKDQKLKIKNKTKKQLKKTTTTTTTSTKHHMIILLGPVLQYRIYAWRGNFRFNSGFSVL